MTMSSVRYGVSGVGAVMHLFIHAKLSLRACVTRARENKGLSIFRAKVERLWVACCFCSADDARQTQLSAVQKTV